ncbi:iron-sulfur assembly protein IscA, chloroplastic [Cynara cardunculus var. scolymus]|uniref:iron-sulfur assembly protein IscA, chloroplastic n=1 Tax=Cynara cardunculus var. scolymus TaxID=59895 RepID=UPI000D62BB29|nr:iron-sulfur assembly protein IscA, chloroplastic [Cynara cardunculus var. scolymus]
MASMAFSSTVRSFSLYRLPNTSSSSSTFVPPASLSTRSLPSRLNLNLRRKNFFIRSISTQAAPASGGLAPAIALTDNALEHLNKMRSERSEDLCLRIGVKQGGCSGMSYTMEFESKENARPDDTVMEYNGFVIVCDPKSLLFIFGMQLDFSDALIGGGFSFKNPNATQTCGCGKSFAAEM